MSKNIIFMAMVVLVAMAACTFDSAGLPANNNTNNTNNLDPCLDVDCGNGDCVADDASTFHCECTGNWAGEACNECAQDYTGDNCEDCAGDALQLEDGSCIEDPCSVEGVCSGHGECSVDLSTGEASCSCENAYTGSDCSECAEFHVEYPLGSGTCEEDQCNGVSCGQGTCVMDSVDSFVCECDLGYVGDFCSVCDTENDYITHDGSCLLSPCHDFACGDGACTVDATSFAASCECPNNVIGPHCELDLNNVLVYQSGSQEIAVQVHGAWGDFQSTIRINFWGDISLGSPVYFNQGYVDENGWLRFNPCAPGVTEYMSFLISGFPYESSDYLDYTNETTPDAKDPFGIIYTTATNSVTMRVQCNCTGGNCSVSPAGND